MFKGLMHKTTYFKRQGRQEQEGTKMTPKTKGNKESKNSYKNFVTTVKISFLFFYGGGAIGKMPLGSCPHVYHRCNNHGILCSWSISLTRTSQNAIEKSSLHALIRKSNSLGKYMLWLKFSFGENF